MVRRIGYSIVEDIDKPMAMTFKKRNKVASVNIVQDSPFAIERQLEDQKYLTAKNKNPQLGALSKANKLRSERVVVHTESALSNKARILNQIVREASGIHQYTLVPPIQEKDVKAKASGSSLALDPETNPALKPYRDENKPIMSTFGHRPRSGSRTFNPATMKIRLKHGEVIQNSVQAASGRGFGLPAAMLSQLLHCPRLDHPPSSRPLPSLGSSDDSSNTSGMNDSYSQPHSQPRSHQFGDLFLSPDDMATLTAKPMRKSSNGGLLLKPLVRKSASANEIPLPRAHRTKRPARQIYEEEIVPNRPLAPQAYKPEWDGNLLQSDKPKYEAYQLRKSVVADSHLLPLKDRLSRFASMSVSDSASVPFCEDKRATDKQLQQAAHAQSQTLFAQSDLRDNNSYYDPESTANLRAIHRQHEKKNRERAARVKAAEHRRVMESVPTVDYQPEIALRQFQNQFQRQSAEQQQQQQQQRSTHLQQLSIDVIGQPFDDDAYEPIGSLRAASRERLQSAEEVYTVGGRGASQRVSSRKTSQRDFNASREASRGGMGGMGKGMGKGKGKGAGPSDEDLLRAIEATKAGDEDALFDFFMRASTASGAGGRNSAEGTRSREREPRPSQRGNGVDEGVAGASKGEGRSTWDRKNAGDGSDGDAGDGDADGDDYSGEDGAVDEGARRDVLDYGEDSNEYADESYEDDDGDERRQQRATRPFSALSAPADDDLDEVYTGPGVGGYEDATSSWGMQDD